MLSRWLMASANQVLPLYHILVVGQSNANGGGGSLLSTATPSYSPQPLMFNNGVRPGGSAGNIASLVPLVESAGGDQAGAETICSGMAKQLNVLYQQAQFLFSIAAIGGTAYSAMKKGTTTYNNVLAQVTAAKAIAQADNRQYKVLAICNLHGEQDQLINNTSYAANLIEWQSDYETDIKAITGQAGTIPMFVDQQSSNPCSGDSAPTPKYVYDAWKSQPAKVVLLGARYTYQPAVTVSNLHFSSYGQRWHGGLFAEAVYSRCILGADWKPLTPIAGQVTLSGTTITVNLNVPHPPVQLKYDWVGRVGASHGFTFTDDSGSPPTVTDVTVSGPSQLSLTLSGAPTGSAPSRKLRYAWGDSTTDSQAGPLYKFLRGNVCDTEVRNSTIDGLPLRNWLAIFEEAVT